MAIVLPHSFQDGVGNVASGVQVMDNFAAVVAALEGVTAAAAGSDLYQAGVVAPADWLPGAVNINGATGVLELTAFGGNAWLPGPVSGLVRTFVTPAAAGGLKPPVLPGPAGFVRVGVELTASGAGATVTVVSGAEKASEAEALAISASPAVSAGKVRVLDVIVKNTAGTYSVPATRDRRTYALGLQRSILPAEESRTNTAYGELAVPDAVEVTMPESGLIAVGYQARWKESVAATARAALFVGSNQLQVQASMGGTVAAQSEAAATGASGAGVWLPLFSGAVGLASVKSSADNVPDVTTGQAVGFFSGITNLINVEAGGTVTTFATGSALGGLCYIFAAAGSYRLTVQFKSSSGTVTVKERKLWAQAVR